MKTVDMSKRNKPLSVTIGADFASPTASPVDIQNQIIKLTNAAQQYLKNGQSALAFDSLMEAYLLDPLNPHVLSCEKSVLPAWENYRQQHSAAPAAQKVNDGDRLTRLKAEKEAQRLAKERQMWEQASRTPRIFGDKRPPGEKR